MNLPEDSSKSTRRSLPRKLYYLAGFCVTFVRVFLHIAFMPRDTAKVERQLFRRLQKTVHRAYKNIPFYRQYWDNNGFHPSMLQTEDDILKIPTIDKDTVREHCEEMADPKRRKRLDYVTTGGTTGMPLQFMLDNYTGRAKELAMQLYEDYFIIGYRRGFHRCLTLRGARIPESLTSKGIYWTRSTRDRGLTMSSFHLLDENYDVMMGAIRKLNPQFIRAYPSSVVALCRLMAKHGDGPWPALKGVICTSENCFEAQREIVRKVLGVEIYSSYGHTEKAVFAYQRGNKVAFAPIYGYVEFIGENGKPETTIGKKAEVVASGFDADAFPLIRYRTNDFVEVDEPAQGFPRTASRVIGRGQDFLVDSAGNHTPFTCADEVFWDLPAISAYQYHQNTPGVLDIHICTFDGSPLTEADQDVILKRAREMFLNFEINIIQVDKIPQTAAGKFRYLVQAIPL